MVCYLVGTITKKVLKLNGQLWSSYHLENEMTLILQYPIFKFSLPKARFVVAFSANFRSSDVNLRLDVTNVTGNDCQPRTAL